MKVLSLLAVSCCFMGNCLALEIDMHTNTGLPYSEEHPCQGTPRDARGCYLRVNPQAGNYVPISQEQATITAIKLCKELALPGPKQITVHYERSGDATYTCRVDFEQVTAWWKNQPRKKFLPVIE